MAKLNRDEILRGLLQTLVDGWGLVAVRSALDAFGTSEKAAKLKGGTSNADSAGPNASFLVAEMDLPSDRKAILSELATRFDEGGAFPKMGDIRSFLLAHHRNGADLKGRMLGFKRMLPVLVEMSPKGLEKLLARSHHSGPADLGEISEAIKGAGETLRGNQAGASKPIEVEEPGAGVNRPPQHD